MTRDAVFFIVGGLVCGLIGFGLAHKPTPPEPRRADETLLIRKGEFLTRFSTVVPVNWYFRKRVFVRGNCPDTPPIAGVDIVASRYGESWRLLAVEDGNAMIEIQGSAYLCRFDFPDSYNLDNRVRYALSVGVSAAP